MGFNLVFKGLRSNDNAYIKMDLETVSEDTELVQTVVSWVISVLSLK
jgi:hypothetical protein